MAEPISIAEATRRVIQIHPSILDGIRQGVINYSALAELIRDRVLRLANRKSVQIDAIKMALMRYAEELKESRRLLETSISKVIAQSKLELKNDVAVLTVHQHALINKFDALTKFMEGARFFQLLQGTQTFTIVAQQTLLPSLIEFIGEKYIVASNKDQSALILISPPEIIDTPGIVAYVSDLFASHEINITQFMSCHLDTIFIISRDDSRNAYGLLEDKIMLFREILTG
ncbi:MAG: ACT domain-containing protein [Promethearchaeota archaeon]|nr:MAG: ACT domain-containing protein [Candidatus Lokiarchaeota archaeon]